MSPNELDSALRERVKPRHANGLAKSTRRFRKPGAPHKGPQDSRHLIFPRATCWVTETKAALTIHSAHARYEASP